jgi:hypothetical protein
MFPRKRLALRLEGRTHNGTTCPQSAGRVRLDVRDLSLGGLAATVDEPLISGSRMAVFFPPQHDCQGVLAGGKVVRCERDGARYRIGVEFDRFPAARGRLPYTAPELSRYCMAQ